MNYVRIVREMLKVTKENQTALAKRLGVTQPTVSRWIRDIQKPEFDQAERIIAEARNLGIVDGVHHSSMRSVQVVGYVGAGGEVLFSEGQGPFEEVPMPPDEEAPSVVAVRVRGDSMVPQLEDGWLVYYSDRKDPPTDDLFDKLCVVGLADGRVLIKKLYRGRGKSLFDLYSANAAPLQDQPVEWAARITWIAPK